MKVSKINRRYGWKRQLPDFRDFKFVAKSRILAALPPAIDLRPGCSPIYNQGNLGSCTANAIGSAHHFGQLKQQDSDAFSPSRLFIYWNERDMEGTVNEDSGAYIRDGMRCVQKQGVCPETIWPYDVDKFRDKPSDDCFKNALFHQVLKYNAVSQQIDQLKACLAEGFPFVFGFAVYESFENIGSDGIMPMPKPTESMLGGHAVKAVGYNDEKRWFIVKNSWGEGWGDKGYFYMPYDYIVDNNLASDFWTIRLVEDEDDSPEPGPTPDPTPIPPEPTPDPNGPCDCSLAFPATKAFVDAAVSHADMGKEKGKKTSMDALIEAGLRGLQAYLQRVEVVRNRRK
jgi:C1A family cysteine protease